MSDTPTITQQYSFAVGEDGEANGEIEPAEESVETSLETFGADVDHRERDSRVEQPEATTFGVDDRPEVTSADAGEQGSLFADTEDDQRTLTGERAASQCLFGSDDGRDDTTPDDHDEQPADTATEPATPRAVATDGGTNEDSESAPQNDSGSDEVNGSDESDNSHEHTEDAGSDDQDTTFDADEETVTDAWEGAFISASWGYGQTNVELAQIVEVSDSGKTVLARFVTAERVDHGRTNEQLRPTANQYGDEFRLHVRAVRGDPMFRGSYPLSNDGDMTDGPTRRGSFYPFDNDPDNSIRQTATNHGH